jgi:hypothetical protein
VAAQSDDEGRLVQPRGREKLSGLNAGDELINDPRRMNVDVLTRRRVIVKRGD